MKIVKTKIEGLLIIQPQVFGDKRGFFMETYNEQRYKKMGINLDFVQDNLSKSTKGVLRGLHFQKEPHAQSKLVQVISGAVLDVAVDIRHSSSTFGQWVSVKLTAKNKKQFWIPSGFAHGFLALENDTLLSYKCTNFYNPKAEVAIMWNDKSLDIDWQLEKNGIFKPIISEKDQKNTAFKDISKIFLYK